MTEVSKTCPQMTLEGTHKPISSAASAAGRSPSSSPAGQTQDRSGREVALVSRFRALEKDRALPINDISGPLFTPSSPSADLQSALENKCRQNLGSNGCPLYELTWKPLNMLVGPSISRLRALGRRTSGNDFSGWPTPTESTGGPEPEGSTGRKLSTVATMAGWPKTKATDANKAIRSPEGVEKEARRKGANNELPVHDDGMGHAGGEGSQGSSRRSRVLLRPNGGPGDPLGATDSNADSNDGLVESDGQGFRPGRETPEATRYRCTTDPASGVDKHRGMGNGERKPRGERSIEAGGSGSLGLPDWHRPNYVLCRDGEDGFVVRPIPELESGVFPLAAGLPNDLGDLRPYVDELAELADIDFLRCRKEARTFRRENLSGFGNSINPVLGAEFVKAYMAIK